MRARAGRTARPGWLDWLSVSVGDGCTIAGIFKGLYEMTKLGLLERLPQLLGVQATGAAPIVTPSSPGLRTLPLWYQRRWQTASPFVNLATG